MSIAPLDNKIVKSQDKAFSNLFNDGLAVSGDLTLDGNLDVGETAGQVRVINAITTPTAGSVNKYLQVQVNGTLFKVALLNIS